MMWHTQNKRLPWQHLIESVFDKICKKDRQRCKIKVRKLLFNILRRFAVMEENPKGVDSAPTPVRIGLKSIIEISLD